MPSRQLRAIPGEQRLYLSTILDIRGMARARCYDNRGIDLPPARHPVFELLEQLYKQQFRATHGLKRGDAGRKNSPYLAEMVLTNGGDTWRLCYRLSGVSGAWSMQATAKKRRGGVPKNIVLCEIQDLREGLQLLKDELRSRTSDTMRRQRWEEAGARRYWAEIVEDASKRLTLGWLKNTVVRQHNNRLAVFESTADNEHRVCDWSYIATGKFGVKATSRRVIAGRYGKTAAWVRGIEGGK